jgi:hypothetical protein
MSSPRSQASTLPKASSAERFWPRVILATSRRIQLIPPNFSHVGNNSILKIYAWASFLPTLSPR